MILISLLIQHSLSLQLAAAKRKQERELADIQLKAATTDALHVTEGTSDDHEEGQTTATSEFTMEGLSGVGSEMDRVHIAERNKAMAAKLKVCIDCVCYGWPYV